MIAALDFQQNDRFAIISNHIIKYMAGNSILTY